MASVPFGLVCPNYCILHALGFGRMTLFLYTVQVEPLIGARAVYVWLGLHYALPINVLLMVPFIVRTTKYSMDVFSYSVKNRDY
jgi:hypothetical protein